MIKLKFFGTAAIVLLAVAAGCTGAEPKQQVQPQGAPSATALPPIETSQPSYKFEDFLAVKQLILENGKRIDATHVKYVVSVGGKYIQQEYRLKAYFPNNASKAVALGITYIRLEPEYPPPPVPEELKDKIMEGNLSQGLRAFFFQLRGTVVYPDGTAIKIKRVYVPEMGEVEVEEKIFQKYAESILFENLIKK